MHEYFHTGRPCQFLPVTPRVQTYSACSLDFFIFKQDDQMHRAAILHQVLPKAWRYHQIIQKIQKTLGDDAMGKIQIK